MEFFFEPKTIALIGATPNKEKAAYVVLQNLKKYKGNIYLVNPKYEEIEGMKCYKSVRDIEETIDLAVIMVNAKVANEVIKECFEKKVKGIVVITAGYKEIGGEGVERERELKELLKTYNYSTRIVGPNCLGILDNISGLDILFVDNSKVKKPPQGNISLFFQSGALGEGLIDEFAKENIGIARFVSYGNAVDIKEIDAISFFAKDKHTKVIGGYVEGIERGREFASRIKSSQKPVILIKGGKGKEGSKAVATHTGSLASNYKVFRDVMKQNTAIIAENFNDFKNYLKAFSYLKKPSTQNILIITNGGGYGVLAVDEAEKYNLDLYKFTQKDKEKVKEFLPAHATPHNPLDLIGDAPPERYKKALEYFTAIKEIGVIVVIVLAQTFAMNESITDILIEYAKKKPLIAVMQGSNYVDKLKHKLHTHGVATYESSEDAIRSLAKVIEYYNAQAGI